jgi:septal ring factor EnvC (AmiA/AmiB activator)
MSETFWEPGIAVESQPGQQNEAEAQERNAEPPALTVSSVDFSALEDRIIRAVEVLKRERQIRAAAEERAANAESQLNNLTTKVNQLEKDLQALQSERDHVRQRVERLLSQLDALEV